MLNAFIPEIGTRLKLTKDWTFDLFLEPRNKQVFSLDGKRSARYNETSKSYKRMLPKGTVFQVDRIYVRQGSEKYSSVTLFIVETTDPVLTKKKKRAQPFKTKGCKHYGRFWVKLIQFNEAEMVVTHDASRPLKTKEVCGDTISLKRFKSKKNACWWVKFEHENPGLAFDGKLNQWLLGPNRFSRERRRDLLDLGWIESWEEKREWDGTSYVEYTYSPPHYCSSLVPDSWREANDGKDEYLKKEKGFGGFETVVLRHPLESEIHIPRYKSKREALNLPNDKALLKRVPVAGGFLTICEVKEVEA